MRREKYLTQFRAAQPGQKVTEMLIYAGTPVYRYDWWADEEFTLQLSLDPKAVDMSRLASDAAPITLDHDRSTQATVGSVRNARLTPRGLLGEANRFEEGDAAETWAKVDAGVLRALSVEALILEQEDITPKGAKLKQFLATSWQPQLVSIVAVGADPAAQFLSEEFQDFWLPEQYRRQHKLDAGAASTKTQQGLLPLLLMRRRS